MHKPTHSRIIKGMVLFDIYGQVLSKKRFNLLTMNTLRDDPFSGHLFIFRGRRGDMIKVLWADRDGLCLFTKRLERGASSGR